MPLWLFAAGRLYGDISVSIPYRNLILGLFYVAVPCFLGIALRWWRHKVALTISRAVKIIGAVFIMWFVIFGSIVHSHIFSSMVQAWYILPACMILPYTGVTLGALIAWILKQSRDRIVTIAIETGIQEVGVAILVLLFSLDSPDNHIAAVVPVTYAVFTPLPFAVAAVVRVVYRRCWTRGRCQGCGGPDGKAEVKAEGSSDENILPVPAGAHEERDNLTDYNAISDTNTPLMVEAQDGDTVAHE